MEDIKADLLPPITWITPRFELSEHPEFTVDDLGSEAGAVWLARTRTPPAPPATA